MNSALEQLLAGLNNNNDVYVSRISQYEDNKWIVFQNNELGFWKNKYASGYYPDYTESFQRTMSRFNINKDLFSEKKVLEVGCGPQGFSASLVQLAKKKPKVHVIVDSLLDKYQEFPTFSLFGRETIKIAAFGECMPVPDNYFDIVFCQNVLDHVNKPVMVVNEILRSLVSGGTALISVHIVPSTLKYF